MIKRAISLSSGTSPGTNQGLTVTHKGRLNYTKPVWTGNHFMYFRTFFYVQDNLVALKRKIVK